MTEHQLPIEKFVVANSARYRELLPDVGEAYEALTTEVYRDGALAARIKRLMALTAALTHGCRGCILYQTEQALELGASVEEILEACGVAISVGGTMAGGETARVIQLLRELGKIE